MGHSGKGVSRDGKKKRGRGRPRKDAPIPDSERMDLAQVKLDYEKQYLYSRQERSKIADVLRRISVAERTQNTAPGKNKDEVVVLPSERRKKEYTYNMTRLLRLADYWKKHCEFLEGKLRDIAKQEQRETAAPKSAARRVGLFDREQGIDPGGNGVLVDRGSPPNP